MAEKEITLAEAALERLRRRVDRLIEIHEKKMPDFMVAKELELIEQALEAYRNARFTPPGVA